MTQKVTGDQSVLLSKMLIFDIVNLAFLELGCIVYKCTFLII